MEQSVPMNAPPFFFSVKDIEAKALKHTQEFSTLAGFLR